MLNNLLTCALASLCCEKKSSDPPVASRVVSVIQIVKDIIRSFSEKKNGHTFESWIQDPYRVLIFLNFPGESILLKDA